MHPFPVLLPGTKFSVVLLLLYQIISKQSTYRQSFAFFLLRLSTVLTVQLSNRKAKMLWGQGIERETGNIWHIQKILSHKRTSLLHIRRRLRKVEKQYLAYTFKTSKITFIWIMLREQQKTPVSKLIIIFVQCLATSNSSYSRKLST